MINRALRQWRAGEPSLGVWLSTGDLYAAEILAGLGFDWLCIDLQHGFTDPADLAAMVMATRGSPTTAIVRVAGNQFDQIGRALDAGAHGVIVPMVSTVEEARRAAAACRYPPDGMRSMGPVRGVADAADYIRTSSEETACVVMIETAEGLANVEAIAAIRGVDALFIGPADLCAALGLSSTDYEAPAFKAALQTILAAGVKARKPVGIFGYSAGLARRYFAEGFTFAPIGTDTLFIREGAAAALKTARPG